MLSVMQGYYGFGTIKRTVSRPVYRGPLRGDIQTLPPRSWCENCGAEVYREGERLCRRCKENALCIMDNGQWTMMFVDRDVR